MTHARWALRLCEVRWRAPLNSRGQIPFSGERLPFYRYRNNAQKENRPWMIQINKPQMNLSGDLLFLGNESLLSNVILIPLDLHSTSFSLPLCPILFYSDSSFLFFTPYSTALLPYPTLSRLLLTFRVTQSQVIFKVC